MVAIKAHLAEAFLKRLDPKIEAFLYYGSDAGLVAERGYRTAQVLAALSTPAAEIVRIDDDDLAADPHRLGVELQTVSMFGGRSIVRAMAGRRIDGKSLKPLLQQAPLSNYLIVEAGALTPANELRTIFEKASTAAAIACYGDESRDLGSLIDDVLKETRHSIGPHAKAALVERLGADRALSRNEIEKLALYAAGRRVIDEQDIDAIVGDAADMALDKIVNATCLGQLGEATAHADRLAAAGEQPQAIVMALQRHFMVLHKIGSAVVGGRSPESVVQATRPPIYFKQQPILIQHCRAWSVPMLTSALKLIDKALIDARLSRYLEAAIVERLIMNLCALAQRAAQHSRGPSAR